MERLAVELPGLKMQNPLMPASGTFGFGDAYGADRVKFDQLGAFVMKTPNCQTERWSNELGGLNQSGG